MALDLNQIPWTTASDCDTLTGWTTEAGTVALGTVPTGMTSGAAVGYAGQTKVKITSGANAVSGLRFALGGIPTSGRIRLHIYVEQMSATAGFMGCTFYAAKTAPLSNYYNKYVRLNQGMNIITLSREVFATAATPENCWRNTTGSPDWDAVLQTIRLDFDTVGAGRASIAYICKIEVGGYDMPIFCPTFDDSWATAYTIGQPILDEYGIKATMYVIGNSISGGSYGTTNQLDNWIAAGHAIGSHTYSHQQNVLNQSGVSQATCEAEIEAGFTALDNLGYPDYEHFMSPYGEHIQESNPNYMAAVRATCKTAGTTIQRNEPTTPGDWHNLGRYTEDHKTDGVPLYQRCMRHAVGSGGVYIPLYHKFHASTDADTLTVIEANFRALCEERALMIQGGTMRNYTIPEWYELAR